MNPPWIAYPDIQSGAIGWRMGPSEQYYNEFYRWFSALSATQRVAYTREHPEPPGWAGFFDRIKAQPW